MSSDRFAGVPILTDAVELPLPAPPGVADVAAQEIDLAELPAATPPAPLSAMAPVIDLPAPPAAIDADEAPEIDEDELVRRITGDVQKQIDLMFEYRLREALVPTLARISDMLIRETRLELALTLRDVVARAVAQEVARHRAR